MKLLFLRLKLLFRPQTLLFLILKLKCPARETFTELWRVFTEKETVFMFFGI